MKLFDARTSVRFVERQFNYMYLNQDKRSYQKMSERKHKPTK